MNNSLIWMAKAIQFNTELFAILFKLCQPASGEIFFYGKMLVYGWHIMICGGNNLLRAKNF